MQIFAEIRDTMERFDRDDGDGDRPIFHIPGVIKIWGVDSDRAYSVIMNRFPATPD